MRRRSEMASQQREHAGEQQHEQGGGDSEQVEQPSGQASAVHALERSTFREIVCHVYAMGDPAAEYERLSIALHDDPHPGAWVARANVAEANALDAHRLYLCAKADLVVFLAQSDERLARMKGAALEQLVCEKDRRAAQKLSTGKVISADDIAARVALLFPDEWVATRDERARYEGMVSQCERLAQLWVSRCYTLSTLVGRRRNEEKW